MNFYGKSVTGNIRQNNEDYIYYHMDSAPFFAMVSDGMGGAVAGEIASSTVCNRIAEHIINSKCMVVTKDIISDAIEYANNAIIRETKNRPELSGMGCTLTFAAFNGNEVLIAQVGDSAAYLFDYKNISKITKDHSYIQELKDAGKYSDDIAKKSKFRNFITRAFGTERVTPDYYNVLWKSGQIILLCTDGLTKNTDIYNSDILFQSESVKNKTEKFVNHALNCGGTDNISLIMCENSVGLDSVIAGRYRICAKIDEGGFSNVYRAYDKVSDREVALKILKEEYIHNSKITSAFKKEANIALKLKSENIVNSFDCDVSGPVHYLAMDYINGVSLKELIINGSLNLDRIINISKKILLALEYAHSKGVIHYDIKPQNIMIDEKDEPFLMDFGLAGIMNSGDDTKVIGSVYYFSPEQAQRKYTDKRTDIYSFGIMLYEMIFGRVPFDGDSSLEIALKRFNEDLPYIFDDSDSIPESIKKIIFKATKRDKTERYRTALQMYKDMNLCFVDPKGSYIDVSGYINVKDDTKKKRRIHIGAIILILCAIAFVVLAFTFVFRDYAANVLNAYVYVPDVIAQDISDAKDIFYKNNLNINIEYQSNDSVEKDVVFDMEPEPGTQVKKEGSVTVYVSNGASDIILMPDIVGMKLIDGKKVLESEGITDYSIKKVEIDGYDSGYIIDQYPQEDSVITDDSIIITVCN